MFLLRRSAARALSAAPSKAFIATPRSITTIAPAARLRQQQSAISAFQRRFASDTPDNFAQTATEAPLEDGLTPAPVDSTDGSATVGADALDKVARDQSRDTRTRTRAPANPPNKILYVGNLFYEVTSEQLTRVFSRFGEIESVRIIYDNRGLSRGFAYIEFKSIADAQTAVDNLDMQVFEGRNLVCQFNRPNTNARERTPFKDNKDNKDRDTTPAAPSNTLFIGNMSFEMSDKDLNDLFRDVQNVLDVRVAIDRRTGQPRGFAHADFVDVASATKAKAALGGKTIYGRDLRVDFSKPTVRRSSERGERSERRERNDSPTEQ